MDCFIKDFVRFFDDAQVATSVRFGGKFQCLIFAFFDFKHHSFMPWLMAESETPLTTLSKDLQLVSNDKDSTRYHLHLDALAESHYIAYVVPAHGESCDTYHCQQLLVWFKG